MKTAESIMIGGIGWLDGSGWGCVLSGRREAGAAACNALWKRRDVFETPVRNLGRFDGATRLTVAACGLALADAAACGFARPARGIGLVISNREGSLQANLAYFRDYLQAGRTLARGNLFIYTLPSSPLAEASIYFGFDGPMFYAGFTAGLTENLIGTARAMMSAGAPGVMAVRGDESGAVAFLLGREAGAAGGGLRIDDVALPGWRDEPAPELASRLQQAKRRIGSLCA